jgi:hypothetical protein
MSFVPGGGTFRIVYQLNVDEATLRKVAEFLGIEGEVVSGTIYVNAPPPSTPPQSSSATPSPASKRRRQRK